jgi:hypothetical protein
VVGASVKKVKNLTNEHANLADAVMIGAEIPGQPHRDQSAADGRSRSPRVVQVRSEIRSNLVPSLHSVP